MEDCGDIVNRDVIRNSCWAVPEEMGDPAVVAMIGLDAMPRGECSYNVRTSARSGIFVMSLRQSMECLFIMVVICVIRMNLIGKIRTYDIVCAEYAKQYNFDALEGMEVMVFERLKGPNESDVAPAESVMMVIEKTGSTHDCGSVEDRERDTWEDWCEYLHFEMDTVP